MKKKPGHPSRSPKGKNKKKERDPKPPRGGATPKELRGFAGAGWKSSFLTFLVDLVELETDAEVPLHLVRVGRMKNGAHPVHFEGTTKMKEHGNADIRQGVEFLKERALRTESRHAPWFGYEPDFCPWILPNNEAPSILQWFAENHLLMVRQAGETSGVGGSVGRSVGRHRGGSDGTLEDATWIGAATLSLEIKPAPDGGQVAVGQLVIAGETVPIASIDRVVRNVAFMGGRLSKVASLVQARWLARMKGRESIPLTPSGFEEVLALAAGSPDIDVRIAEELLPETKQVAPTPRLRIARLSGWRMLPASLCFDYEGLEVAAGEEAAVVIDREREQRVTRDLTAEAGYVAALLEVWPDCRPMALQCGLPAELVPAVVTGVIERGFEVIAEDRRLRVPTRRRFRVRASGKDWFDLDGWQLYDEMEIPFPALLEAIGRGETTVALPDGSLGFLPVSWLRSQRVALAVGTTKKGTIRFTTNQTAFLDALLAENDLLDLDARFEVARERIRGATCVGPADPGPSFAATLRPYQRDGYGWLRYLREVGFGGCLADDMGLGKTVQILALLNELRGGDLPSLVVAPRSLMFHWQDEAQRFAPELVVRVFHGPDRAAALQQLQPGEVLITTYGTLRNDLALADRDFDVVVLDEAQAIKNRGTATAQAARALRGRQRIAVSGTPVENHLGELDSLFSFLNPGLLGGSRFAKEVFAKEDIDATDRARLAAALRPFLLRRTKSQVARELPDRVEQTIRCEMEDEQRRLYDELRDHYRASLREKLTTGGGGATMHVLEALLRLRQAACHAGMIAADHKGVSSTKLDALVPMLQEIAEEGHKALVFSQFTSFLALLKERLDAAGLRYESLDGRTRDRAAPVKRFQEDLACPVFLISLKAGGVGLNLTAASYVFLLDPWWNPAAEAQAIDRAHRIGQTQTVTAYRLLVRDTVEEKIAALQAEKRELADSLFGEDHATLKNLDVEEIQALLE